MKMFIYESHLGGIYCSEEEYDWDDLYCDECGDTDWPVGSANNKKEFLFAVKDLSYAQDYILEVANEYFSLEVDNETN